LAVLTGWGLLWPLAFIALGGAVLLDILRWERVAVSAHNLWFQRGFRNNVHQVALENIRDVSVDESAARGFTLRHGIRNRLVRLAVRMADKRVVALPKTDAFSGLDSVEAVANHLRMRLQQLRERERERDLTTRREAPIGDLADLPSAMAAQEEELRKALRQLRAGAAKQRGLKSSTNGS
jgi:hypothetical protein